MDNLINIRDKNKSIKIIDSAKIDSLEEYEELAAFLSKTNDVVKKMTVCLQQLDMEVMRLKYEVKAASNEHTNFMHKLEEFELNHDIKRH